MVLIAVEAVSADSKPPATDDSMRTSIGGRCSFAASAPLLTRASPMHFSGVRVSAIVPKLVKLVGPSSTLAEELSPCFIRSAEAAPYVRLQVFVSGSTFASVARRGCLYLYALNTHLTKCNKKNHKSKGVFPIGKRSPVNHPTKFDENPTDIVCSPQNLPHIYAFCSEC